jgi:hypothetical protein
LARLARFGWADLNDDAREIAADLLLASIADTADA